MTEKPKQAFFNVTIGEIPGGVKAPCNICEEMVRDGLCCHLLGTVYAQVVCFSCVANRLYRFQQMHSDKVLLEVDMKIEGPELRTRFVQTIQRVAIKYNLSDSDAVILADALLEALDDGKFDR